MGAFRGRSDSNTNSGQGFNLYSNSLTGSIPSELGRLTSLSSYFQLRYNTLCGEIPPEVATLSSLVAHRTALIKNEDDDGSKYWAVGDGNSALGTPCP